MTGTSSTGGEVSYHRDKQNSYKAMGVLDPNDIKSFIDRHIEEICEYYGVHRELCLPHAVKTSVV